MGFFDRLFGKKPNAPAIRGRGKDVLPPPDFDRAVEMQRAYWTHDAEEQAQLEARSADPLDWRERLRLHHLICLQRLIAGPAREATSEKCRQSVRSLIATDSPYRPQSAMIWQGQAANGSKPNMQGEFLNPSLTHLGCLEIYRVDAAIHPSRLRGFQRVVRRDVCITEHAPRRETVLQRWAGRDRPFPHALWNDLDHRE